MYKCIYAFIVKIIKSCSQNIGIYIYICIYIYMYREMFFLILYTNYASRVLNQNNNIHIYVHIRNIYILV